jgi:transaldolase
MKIFLDTANIGEIRASWDAGFISGVTTNPTLVSRERRGFEAVIRDIASIVTGPICAQVTSPDYDGMTEEARTISSWASNIVVKIPVTADGIKAVRTLSAEGMKTAVTLVFSPAQAILAEQAGASYVAPYVGRLEDIGSDGLGVIRDIASVFKVHEAQTRIIAASVRHPRHVIEAAKAGADIITVPYAVLAKMAAHPLTSIGVERFERDWKKHIAGSSLL